MVGVTRGFLRGNQGKERLEVGRKVLIGSKCFNQDPFVCKG